MSNNCILSRNDSMNLLGACVLQADLFLHYAWYCRCVLLVRVLYTILPFDIFIHFLYTILPLFSLSSYPICYNAPLYYLFVSYVWYCPFKLLFECLSWFIRHIHKLQLFTSGPYGKKKNRMLTFCSKLQIFSVTFSTKFQIF